MIYIALILSYVIWLYFKSKSNFFEQDRETLADKRQLLEKVLNDFKVKNVSEWLDVYDAFKNYKKYYKYDGATIVKDLHTINGYDAPAGNHDFAYINLQWFTFKGFIQKFKIDYQYGLDMRVLKIPYFTAWIRVFLLWLSTPIWYILLIIKKRF